MKNEATASRSAGRMGERVRRLVCADESGHGLTANELNIFFVHLKIIHVRRHSSFSVSLLLISPTSIETLYMIF